MKHLIQITLSLLMLFSITANAALPSPSELCQPHKKYFTEYEVSADHKAFAVSSEGSYGWSAGKATIEEAKKAALLSCQKHTDETCRIYAVDNSLFHAKK